MVPKKSYHHYVALLFLFATIFDMQGKLGLRYAVWGLLLLYTSIFVFTLRISPAYFLYWFFILFLFPLTAALIGFLSVSELNVFLYLTPFCVSPIIFSLSKNVSIDIMVDYFFRLLLVLAVVVLATNLWVLFDDSILYFDITRKFYANIDYFSGKRISVLIPKVYHQATLFFSCAAIYYLVNKKFMLVGLMLLAMTLSASKGAVLIFSLFACVYGVLCFSFAWKIRAAIVLISVFVIAIGFQPALVDSLVSTVLLENETTSKRLLQIESLVGHFSQNPVWILTGQGLGTSFFSAGDQAFVTNAELDHFETVRRYGLIWCLLFFASVIYTGGRLFFSRSLNLRALGLSMLAAFFAAGTNPVLISSVFLVLFTLSLLSLVHVERIDLINNNKRLSDVNV